MFKCKRTGAIILLHSAVKVYLRHTGPDVAVREGGRGKIAELQKEEGVRKV